MGVINGPATFQRMMDAGWRWWWWWWGVPCGARGAGCCRRECRPLSVVVVGGGGGSGAGVCRGGHGAGVFPTVALSPGVVAQVCAWCTGFVSQSWGGLLALRPPQPQRILTQNLAEGNSSSNQRPFVGPTQTPRPPVRTNPL